MSDLTRAAATAAAIVPFSCVICFDEFDKKDRPPVVLPCGHTYVCLPCSKRLRRCMECREPLFVSSHLGKPQRPIAVRSRCHPRSSPPTTPTSTPPSPVSSHSASRALPIPRNVVLLALMEAVEMQSTQTCVECDDESSEDPFDMNHILTGLATMSGPCGTYSVREGPLQLLKNDPRTVVASGDQVIPGAEEKKDDESRDACSPTEVEEYLVKGQTVQVVEFDNGVAKLARDKGFVRTSSSCLVKVGDARDESCKLQGILSTLEGRGRDLQSELEANQQMIGRLQEQLQSCIVAEPDAPIISDPPVPPPPPSCGEDPKASPPTTPISYGKLDQKTLCQPVLGTPDTSCIYDSQEDLAELDPNTDNLPQLGPGRPRSIPGSPVSIDNADINGTSFFPLYRRANSAEELESLAVGCGASFLGNTSHLFGSAYVGGDENSASIESDSDPHQIVTTSSIIEVSSPPIVNPSLTGSFDKVVDFRTGLSGHGGLVARKRGGASRGHIRMMGDHRGISHIRPLNRTSSRSSSPIFSHIGPL